MAVTELVEGDSSRKIVEIICRTSWLKSENQCGRIERVLKVHNMQKTLARFEEYRETVKIKASKLHMELFQRLTKLRWKSLKNYHHQQMSKALEVF